MFQHPCPGDGHTLRVCQFPEETQIICPVRVAAPTGQTRLIEQTFDQIEQVSANDVDQHLPE